MGEVYRARDSRLERDVAVKVIASQMASRPDLRLRFEREAKTISSLSHPNICTLYDVGEAQLEEPGNTAAGIDRVGGAARLPSSAAPSTVLFLVMELLEGETLRDRIARGALPLDQVLKIGVEVSEALADAHRHGVAHRDLKPGNIMLTRSGAKLLDFGLAKHAAILSERAPDDSTAVRFSDGPPLTEKGAIVGTLQYMAPEQLEGSEADTRTDIFALGVVLYEMLTGRRAFEGKTKASLIASILEREPPAVRELTPLTPPALEHVILKCLEKDREARWQSCHDIAEQLRWIARKSPEAALRRTPWQGLAGWGVAAVLALAALTAYYRLAGPSALPAQPQLQFTIPAPETILGPGAAVSPDGSNIVFTAAGSEGARLWLRPLDGIEPRPLAGTEGGAYPFWSPDGRRIGFFADGKLRKIDVSTGEVLTICEAGPGGGGTWNAENVIVFAPDWESNLYRVSAAGGSATELTGLASAGKDTTHLWPHFLPDGRRFLFSAIGPEHSGLYVGSLDSEEITSLMPAKTPTDVSLTVYADGYIFFGRDLALFAQQFDPQPLALTGQPIRIAESLHIWGPGMTTISASSAGVLVFSEEPPPRDVRLTWFSSDGGKLEEIEPAGAYAEFDVSPDERRAAVRVRRVGSPPQIALLDLARGVTTPITRDHWHATPHWTPDGKNILYSASIDTPPNIFVYDQETGETRRLHRSQTQTFVSDVSPAGSHLVVHASDRDTGWDVYTMPVAGGEPTPLIRGPANERRARISPDGRWLIWTSDETGREEIYMASFPSLGGKIKVSVTGGVQPAWAPDGSRIYYREGERLMSVRFEPGATDAISPPREVFSAPFQYYGVTRSGRLLVGLLDEQPRPRPLRVIVNWKAALGRS